MIGSPCITPDKGIDLVIGDGKEKPRYCQEEVLIWMYHIPD